MKKFGGQRISVDRHQGSDHDVLGKSCQDWLTWLVKTRRVRSVMLAVPCETFSRARRGNAIVRSSEKTLGINNIDSKFITKVREANRIWFFTYKLIRLLNALEVPWCLENPLSSILWWTPQAQRLIKTSTCITVHYCQYGVAWKKATRLMFGNCEVQESCFRRCHPRGSICSRTLQPHHRLKGFSPQGISWAKIAELYPKALAAEIARVLYDN